MHPALSIIAFTTLSGTGLGLAFWLGTAEGNNGSILALSVLLAAALTSLGLFLSLLHLRRPSRAWRALSQWRSSWLSREGILAPACVLMMGVHMVGTAMDHRLTHLSGYSLILLGPVVVFTTSMIYAQIRAVPAWNTKLTPAMFLAFAASSGFYLLLVIDSWTGAQISSVIFPGLPVNSPYSLVLANMCNILAWYIMLLWWRRRDRTGTGASSTGTATGLYALGRISQLDPPHTEPNYLTTEMGYRVARKHSVKLRSISLLVGLVLPIVLVGSAILHANWQPIALALALILHVSGVTISRWLFFAEATHTQSLYYSGNPVS